MFPLFYFNRSMDGGLIGLDWIDCWFRFDWLSWVEYRVYRKEGY